jgi:hypothetical protein
MRTISPEFSVPMYTVSAKPLGERATFVGLPAKICISERRESNATSPIVFNSIAPGCDAGGAAARRAWSYILSGVTMLYGTAMLFHE